MESLRKLLDNLLKNVNSEAGLASWYFNHGPEVLRPAPRLRVHLLRGEPAAGESGRVRLDATVGKAIIYLSQMVLFAHTLGKT